MKPIHTWRSQTGLSSLLIPVVLVAGMGACALLGWGLGVPRLASIRADWIPMAPSTAVLFLLFGTSIGLRAKAPANRRVFWISVAAGCVGAAMAILFFVLSCLGIHPAIEHLGVATARTVGRMPMGHMSPVTAFCFLLSSVSFLGSLSPTAARRWRAVLALGSACLLLATCYVFLLGYLYGSPLLYGGSLIPPAFNTVVTFVMLGWSLVTLSVRLPGAKEWQPKAIPERAYGFLLVFGLLAAGIIASGYFHYRHYEQHYRIEVERQLAAVAELKREELERWRLERLGDGVLFFRNPLFTGLVRRFLAQPADTEAQRQLLDWLGKSAGSDDCDQVLLLDVQGVCRLALPAGSEPVCTDTVRTAAEVLKAGRVAIQDFYRCERDERVHMAVQVPILDETAAGRPLGVLVLRINPATYLYPFIQHWPTPSLTAETLIIRRDGNDVLYLNELRHHSNAALTLRVPLDRASIPAVQAVLGRTGFIEGVDYRGVPVLTVANAVPDSPWVLLTKMDIAEVYGPLRDRFWQEILLIGALLLGAGAFVGLAWRRQRLLFYRELSASASELSLFKDVVHDSPNAIGLATPEGKHYYQNRAFDRLFGEIGSNPPDSVYVDRVLGRRVFDTIIGGGRWEGEVQMFSRDRTLLTIFLRAYPIRDQAGRILGLVGLHADITERKRTEASLRESEHLLQESQVIAGVGSYVLNIATGLWTSSAVLDKVFGIDKAFVRSVDTWTGLIHADDRARMVDHFRNDVVGRGQAFDAEYRIVRGNDRAVRWVHGLGRLEFDAHGHPQKMLGTIQDITEHKLAEAVLEQQMDELRRWRAVTLHREDRIDELKREVNVLAGRLGQPPPYGKPEDAG